MALKDSMLATVKVWVIFLRHPVVRSKIAE